MERGQHIQVLVDRGFADEWTPGAALDTRKHEVDLDEAPAALRSLREPRASLSMKFKDIVDALRAGARRHRQFYAYLAGPENVKTVAYELARLRCEQLGMTAHTWRRPPGHRASKPGVQLT